LHGAGGVVGNHNYLRHVAWELSQKLAAAAKGWRIIWGMESGTEGGCAITPATSRHVGDPGLDPKSHPVVNKTSRIPAFIGTTIASFL
jgi:hypothetical protein